MIYCFESESLRFAFISILRSFVRRLLLLLLLLLFYAVKRNYLTSLSMNDYQWHLLFSRRASVRCMLAIDPSIGWCVCMSVCV